MAMTCVTGGSECDGCMTCRGEEKRAVCPRCGNEVPDKLYYSNYIDKVVGCDDCISVEEIWEVEASA